MKKLLKIAAGVAAVAGAACGAVFCLKKFCGIDLFKKDKDFDDFDEEFDDDFDDDFEDEEDNEESEEETKEETETSENEESGDREYVTLDMENEETPEEGENTSENDEKSEEDEKSDEK